MSRAGWITAWLILMLALCSVSGAGVAFEYPSALLDAYDADEGCWLGLGLWGGYPEAVVPKTWLVGPPPTDRTAVTMPTDHWMDFLFLGSLFSDDGPGIEIRESGPAGEQAIVFVTDGGDQEYALGIAQSAESGETMTRIEMELPEFPVDFTPRGLRIVALDRGGTAPGFDLASVRARVSRQCGEEPAYPNPANGLADVSLDTILSWTPACGSDIHTVYFSADRQAVAECAPESEFALAGPDVNSLEPVGLELGRTYYWRVAEANSAMLDEVSLGEVWSFSVTDDILIDDFEMYVDGGPSLYDAWYPLDRAQAATDPGVFRSCRLGLAFGYYYDNYYEGAYSELFHGFGGPQNWLRGNAKFLELWLYGNPGNSTGGQMYVVLNDGDVQQPALLTTDPNILTTSEWQACRVCLDEFSAVDLTRVVGLGIGILRPASLPQAYGSGTVVIDDISLRSTACIEEAPIAADLNADCVVDYADLSQVASDWLRSQTVTLPTAEPEAPVLWYKFDGDASDSAGTAHGQIAGRPVYAAGKHGQAILFQTDEDLVSVTQVAGVFDTIRDAITISFWQYGEVSPHRNDTICCSNYVYGKSNPSIAIHLGCWRDPGQYRWDCGTPWSIANRVAGHHAASSEWSGRWNHWAFVKDRLSGRMEIYLNGMLYDSRTGADTPIEGITSLQIGGGWYGRYDGLLDDFQIYDYALDAEQVAYLASDGTGLVERAALATADLDATGTVDFFDYALFATAWRDAALWP